MERYWLVNTGPEGEPGINGGMMDCHFDQPVINTVEVLSLTDVIDKVAAKGGPSTGQTRFRGSAPTPISRTREGTSSAQCNGLRSSR